MLPHGWFCAFRGENANPDRRGEGKIAGRDLSWRDPAISGWEGDAGPPLTLDNAGPGPSVAPECTNTPNSVRNSAFLSAAQSQRVPLARKAPTGGGKGGRSPVGARVVEGVPRFRLGGRYGALPLALKTPIRANRFRIPTNDTKNVAVPVRRGALARGVSTLRFDPGMVCYGERRARRPPRVIDSRRHSNVNGPATPWKSP